MKLFVSNKNESVRLFKNPVLEYFSHIHPATPLAVYVPVVSYFLYHAALVTPLYLVPLLWLGGVLFWTALEYVMHRFAFHYVPRSNIGKQVRFLVHGVHHDYPKDGTRLVMPLLVSVPLAFFFYYLYRLLFFPYHEGLYAGLVSGYLAYDCLHFAFHHINIPGKIFSFLKVYHLKHHYNDPTSGYGVSNPLWDYVFRTVPAEVPQKEVSRWADPAAA